MACICHMFLRLQWVFACMLTIILGVLTSRLAQPTMNTRSGTGDEVLDNREFESKTDLEYLRRLQSGDERAWEKLLSDWQGPLYQYLYHSLPDAEAAQEVLGDTFEALVKAIPRFDGKAALSTFIYSIAQRKIADFWRRKKPTTEIPENFTSGREATSESIVFRDVLAALQPQYREALLLRYHMGLGVSEVAQAVGRSYKATESLLSRARKQFETDLRDAGFHL